MHCPGLVKSFLLYYLMSPNIENCVIFACFMLLEYGCLWISVTSDSATYVSSWLVSHFCDMQMGKGVPVTINSVAQAADGYMKTSGVSQ